MASTCSDRWRPDGLGAWRHRWVHLLISVFVARVKHGW